MMRVLLNRSAIERFVARSRSGPDAFIPSFIHQASRRSFIKALLSGGAALYCNPLHAFDFSSDHTRAQLSINGTPIWSLDVAWMAGQPRLRMNESRRKTEVSLSGARYPGTTISADFEALFDLHSDTPTMLLRHALTTRVVKVALLPWLAGEKSVMFDDHARTFNSSAGIFLNLQQRMNAMVCFTPSLALDVTAPGGWQLNGTEFSGLADRLSLSRPGEMTLLDATSPLLRSQMVIHAGTSYARVAPQMEPGHNRTYLAGTVEMKTLRLELAEDNNGAQHQAFLAEGTGRTTISQKTLTGMDNQSVRVLAHDPSYARLLTADGTTNALLVSTEGETLTPFGNSMLVSRWSSLNEPLRVESGTGEPAVSCCISPYTMAVASDVSDSVTIHFPQKQHSSGDVIGRICPFTFTHKEIHLEGAEIAFKRPQNAMFLRFRLDGFRLVRNWMGLTLRASDECRLTVLTGAQSVSEEVFFVPPMKSSNSPETRAVISKRYKDNEKEKYLLSGKFPKDSDLPQLMQFLDIALARPVDDEKNGPEYESPNEVFPSQSVVSGDSQLVYRLASHRSDAAQVRLENLTLSLDSLLDTELWKLVVVKDAASGEKTRSEIDDLQTQETKSLPPPGATCLELPSSLFVSPDENATFRPSGLTTSANRRYHDIFRLVGYAGQSHENIPLRAIASHGFTPETLPDFFKKPSTPDDGLFRTSLEMRDRSELVWLTSQWDQPALLGTRDVRTDDSHQYGNGVGIYIPQPFYASSLQLSSMGGTLKSLGRWDPPSLVKANFALSIERWEHRETFGKLSSETVVYKGYLLPFGIRASFLKVTERYEVKTVNQPELGVMSIPMQKYYIEISNPLVQYSELLAPHAGRTWPFRKIELELRERLQIDDPTRSDICGHKQSAFKICVEPNQGHLFGFDIDGDPRRKGTAMLAFVDNTLAHNLEAMKEITAAFNCSAPQNWGSPTSLVEKGPDLYSMNLLNAKVCYAPPRMFDDTSYVTTLMAVTLGLHESLVNSAVIEASGKPPTYPEMKSASIVIPALNRLTGQVPQMVTEVVIAQLFQQVGFDVPRSATVNNESEVFLSLKTPVMMSFSGQGDRAGAIGTPNMNAHYLSRSSGLMGQTVQVLQAPHNSNVSSQLTGGPVSKISFRGSDLFSPDAKLLGVLKLADLCEVLGLDEIPHFIESARHQIDAAGEDIGIKICQFVITCQSSLNKVLSDHLPELNKFSSLRPLQEHLQAFGTAINAIPCTGKFELDDSVVERVADAGGVLEKALGFVENQLQNPAILLPADITAFITKWCKLTSDLDVVYQGVKDVVKQQHQHLDTAINVAVDEIEMEAGKAVSSQLNSVCAELSGYLTRIVSQTLTPDSHIEPLLMLYEQLKKVYYGVLGYYRELSVNWASSQKWLAPVGKNCLLASADTAKSFIFLLYEIRLNNALFSDEVKRLDEVLRRWPKNEYEEARAFFRRIEPSLDELNSAYLALSTYKLESFSVLSGHLEQFWQALSDINEAQGFPRAASLRIPERQTSYLGDVGAQIARVSNFLVFTFRAVGSIDIKMEEEGESPQKVNQALQTLIKQLDPNLRAIPVVLNDAMQIWQNNVTLSDNEVISRGIGLLKLCAILMGRQTHIPQFLPDPVLYAMCPPSVNELHVCLSAVLIDIDEKLRTWLQVVIPSDTPDWLETASEIRFLLGPRTFDCLTERVNLLNKNYSILAANSGRLNNIVGASFDSEIPLITDIQCNWRALVADIKRIGEVPDRDVLMKIESVLRFMASQLIPAEINIDFNFETKINKSVVIFHPGPYTGNAKSFTSDTSNTQYNASLQLKAHIRQNVLNGSSSSRVFGCLSNFYLDLFRLLIIDFEEVKFESNSGTGPKLHPPLIRHVGFNGCLNVINGLQTFFQGGSGPYVRPVPNGMRAGYLISPGAVPLGGMILKNLIIDASIEMPFDDRAAITTFSVSSRASPALLFIAPYGGTMFFGLGMAGDRLVSIEAEFAAGLVAAFDLGAVTGNGRVTFGFYFKQANDRMLLSGFFFAGGSGNVLGIVSINLALRIALQYEQGADGHGKVTGHGEFSVEIGCSPFEWTLHYSVDYNVPNMTQQSQFLNTNTHGNEPFVAECSLASDTATLPASEQHIYERQKPIPLFLHESTWRKFQDAFAKPGEAEC